MIKESSLLKNQYKITEVSDLIGITTTTLRRWDEIGRVKFSRTKSNIRFLNKDDFVELLKSMSLYEDDISGKKRLVYVRNYENIDKSLQLSEILDDGLELDVIILKDDDSNNDSINRNSILRLLDLIINNKVDHVLIYDEKAISNNQDSVLFFKKLLDLHGIKLIVNNKDVS